MERLDSSIRAALRGAGLPDASTLSAITAAWPVCVGPAIARQAWPLRLSRDGTLRVACTSAVWAFELDRMAPEILDRLRGSLGEATPAAVRFAPGPVPAPGSEVEPQPDRPVPTSTERATAAALAADIDDAELRDLAARAIAAGLARAGSAGRSGILH